MSEQRDYAHGHHSSVLASHAARTASNSCAYFLDRLQPGMRILDIGCGPGSISLDLARVVGLSGEVVGIDFPSDAISHARDALAVADDAAELNATFYTGDVYAFTDDHALIGEGFDVVHAHQVLQHVPDPVEALRVMGTLCSPQGFIAVRDADYSAMTWFPASTELEDWRSTYVRTAREAGGDPDAGRKLKSWALDAGLNIVRSMSSTWTYSTEDETSWWGSSQAERVRKSQFADKAKALGLSNEEIEEIAQGWAQWGQTQDAWFCMMHGELIATPQR